MALIFLDIETTGLDPTKGAILEIAAAEVDSTLEPVRGFSVLIRPEARLLEELDISSVVVKMHTDNGLWRESSAHGFPPAQAYDMLSVWLGEAPKGGHTIAGDSVHFDWYWLKHHAPEAAAKFSHRLLDTSAFMVGRQLAGLPDCDVVGGAHRAESDVLASIAKARWHLSRLVP